MHLLKLLPATVFATLVACAGTTGTDSGSAAVPITTEAEFRSAIVGKTIGFNGNTLVINPDNTVSGPWDGQGITGTWYWEDQFWCRDISIGGNDLGVDCQTWTFDGSTARVTRDRGNGNGFDYTVG